MSFSHLLILGIIAVIVIPPDKLPEVARQVARFLGEMRRMSAGIFDDLKQDTAPQLKPEDNLKRQQQREKEQAAAQPQHQAEPVQTTMNIEPEPEAPMKGLSPEDVAAEKRRAEEEYLKHIQGEPAPIAEEKKPKNE